MSVPPLSIALEARLDQFEAGMSKAGDIAQKAVRDIEKRFAESTPELNTNALTKALMFGAGGALTALGVDKFVEKLVEANKQLADMDETARRVGMTLERFQELRFAANVGGISDEKFASGMDELSKKLNDARREENELSKLLDANNIKFKEGRDLVISTEQALSIALDLIRRTTAEQDKVKVAGMLGLDKEWIRIADEGSKAFLDIAARAQDAGVVMSRDVIDKATEFSREWTKASAEWATKMRAELADLLPMLNDLVQKAIDLLGWVKSLPGAFRDAAEGVGSSDIGKWVSDRLAGLRVEEKAKKAQEMGLYWKDFVESLSDQAEVDAAIRAAVKEKLDVVEIEMLRARGKLLRASQDLGLFGVEFGAPKIPKKWSNDVEGPATKLPKDKKEDEDEARDAFDREADRIKRRNTLMLAEAATVGMTARQHEELRTEMVLLQAVEKSGGDVTMEQIDAYARLRTTMSAQQALAASGIKLTAEQAEEFAKLSQRSADVTETLRRAKEAWQGYNDTLRFSGNQLVDIIDGITSRTRSLSDLGSAALRAFSRELLRAAITGEGAFAKLFGFASASPGGTGGLFGLFGGLFKSWFGGGGGGGAADDWGWAHEFHNASGTENWRGGPTWVGEHGPELVNLPRGTKVIPNHVAAAASTAGPALQLTISNDFRGVDPQSVARLEAQMQALPRQIIAQVVPHIQRARQHSVRV